MRNFLPTLTSRLTILVMVFLLVSPGAFARSQNLGEFTLAEAQKVNVACGSQEIKSITLRAKNINLDDAACAQNLLIDSVAVSYNTGMQQFFEFPIGSTLTSANFRVLPGTKCLSGFSAKIKKRSASCETRVQVLVERES